MPGGIHPPLELIQAWQTDAYPHGVRRDWTLVAIVISLFILTASVVAVRLLIRCLVQHNAGLDDAIILTAMIPTAGLAVSICLGDRLYGFDCHSWDLTPRLAVQSRQATMAISAFYILGTGLTKISILCFYRRIAAGSIVHWFAYTARAAIAFVIAYMIVFLTTLFFGCSPISAFWNQTDISWTQRHQYHCFNESADMLAASTISTVQDFLTCGLPLLLFRKLQMPKRQRIALGALFGVGIFICITGVLRTLYIHALFHHTYDVTWGATPIWATTAVEAHLGIICASAPALTFFFRSASYNHGSSSSGRRGGRRGGGGGGGGMRRSPHSRRAHHQLHSSTSTPRAAAAAAPGPGHRWSKHQGYALDGYGFGFGLGLGFEGPAAGHATTVATAEAVAGPKDAVEGDIDLELGSGITVAREVDVVVEVRKGGGEEEEGGEREGSASERSSRELRPGVGCGVLGMGGGGGEGDDDGSGCCCGGGGRGGVRTVLEGRI